MASMDLTTLAFNISAFIAGISLLQDGADKFTDSTIEIAKYLGVSEILVAILTAGAEWEELSIVILCLVQDRHELAIGLIVGSNIANILGAFSLALVVHPEGHNFYTGSKVYGVVLLFINVLVTVLALLHLFNRTTGIALLIVFLVYVALTSVYISRGVLTAPRDIDPDRESISDNDSEHSDNSNESESLDGDVEANENYNNPTEAEAADENTPLVGRASSYASKMSSLIKQGRSKIQQARSRIRHFIKPLLKLFNGLSALPISSFVMSKSSINLADSLDIPDLVFGVTIIALGTNLPEKLSNIKDQSPESIENLIATITGGNTFLLTLCIGITLVSGDESTEYVSLPPREAFWMLGAALAMAVVVLIGKPSKYLGFLLMAAYIVFIVLELLPFIDPSKFRFELPYPTPPLSMREI